MNTEKVMEVLRRAEWVGDDWHLCCPWCNAWKSQGHYEGCKLAALLSGGEKEKQDELPHPIMVCSACKKLDGICECPGEPIRWAIFELGDEDYVRAEETLLEMARGD